MDSVQDERAQRPAPDAFRSPWMMGPRLDYKPMMPVSDPENRIAFGGGILMLAAMLLWLVDDMGNGRHWFAGMGAFAIGMITSGIRHKLHDARIARLIARARAEWNDLLVGAAAAMGDGEGMPRFLVRRGYREYFVRRWLADRLAGEIARAAGPRA